MRHGVPLLLTRCAAGLALLLAAAGQVAAKGPSAALKLHIPSPDWRDQVIYFAMTDRFDDGDARNNDFGAGEFDQGKDNRYQGGDLRGLARRLDYIQGLGATALWITPPVANQWRSPTGADAGYHGYWAEHFMRVDKHLGTLLDYQRLSDGLHRRGMYLVQDIVLNHTGNYFGYRGGWNAADPAAYFERYAATPPVAAPTQAPFHLNDARLPAHRRAGIYHWTPDISDYTDPLQEMSYQMSGLDDLNTENPRVRRALRRAYGHWIRAAGVDAFRIDTAFYVPPASFVDFLHSRDARAPGIAQVARRTGRQQFHVFGEGFGIDRPGDETQARKIETYMTGADGRPVLPGMLNFPLYGALGDVFARGRPSADLGQRISAQARLHARPHGMPSFIDNHDVDRFLAGGTLAGMQQALLAMFTLPGIPTIYYGTEQGLATPRASMFAAGHGSGGRDRFDTQAPIYRFIAELAGLRRANNVLSRGLPTVLHESAAGPGALAYVMRSRAVDATAGSAVQRGASQRRVKRAVGPSAAVDPAPLLVVFNSADHEVLLDNLAGMPAGTRLQGLFGIHGRPADQAIGSDGRLSLVLAARSGAVWRVGSAGAAASAGTPPETAPIVSSSALTGALTGALTDALTDALTIAPARLTLDPLPAPGPNGELTASGSAHGVARVALVVDGDLARAVRVAPGADGRWSAPVDTSAMIDPAIAHRVVAWGESSDGHAAMLDKPTASPAQTLRIERAWQLLAEVTDPAGDDHGPNGRYVYPQDATYGAKRTMDIRGVRVSGAGGALQIDVTLAELSRSWNPPNGFDHVAFTIFIELPGRSDVRNDVRNDSRNDDSHSGLRAMPLQNAQTPEGMRWHLRLRAHGWSNALFSAEGASATAEGRPLSPAAAIEVDRAPRRVRFTLSAAALSAATPLSATPLGRPASLSGAKIYVTTWDYDGGYRPLTAQPEQWAIGGGDPASGAKVMDDTAVISLP